jgi:hypothetical protein
MSEKSEYSKYNFENFLGEGETGNSALDVVTKHAKKSIKGVKSHVGKEISQVGSNIKSKLSAKSILAGTPAKNLFPTRRESIMYDNEYETINEAGSETPTLDTNSEEDPKLYQTTDGKHAKIDTDNVPAKANSKKNQASIAGKAKASSSIVSPKPMGTPEERLEQTLDALFDGESLTEEFMVKTATIFEAAINERITEIEEDLVRQYENILSEHIAEVTTELAEKLDDYLGYVVENWMQENELAVETGIRSDIAENFIGGLKELFEANYIDIPDEKYNIVEEIAEENQVLQDELNEMIQKNINMRSEMLGHNCQEIFFEEAQDLVDTDVERLATLAEGIEFSDAEQYRHKIQILKESYFGGGVNTSSEYLTEEGSGSEQQPSNNPAMNVYMGAISRHSQANKTV